jgi:hypothetical protein
MNYRNILLIVAAFFILDTSIARTVNAQQPTPTPDRKKAERDKKTDKSDAEKDDEPTEPRQRTQDGRTDAGSIPSLTRSSDKRYRFEVGILPRFNSNLFEAEDDAAKVSSYITTLSGKAEYDFVRNDKRTVTGGVQFRHNIYKDVENANSTDIDLTVHYKSGKNDFQAAYFITPERLAFITGGNSLYVHSSIQGGNFDYTRRLSKRFRAGAAYQITKESYEGTAFDDRNNIRHRISGEVRYRFDYLFQPGIGVEYERVNAASENFNRNGIAPVLLLVSSYKDIVYTSARYRFIRRDYDTNNPLLPNFDRRDYRHDFSLYSVVKLTRQFRLYGFVNALDNNSSRLGRSFTGYQGGLGLFFQFP